MTTSLTACLSHHVGGSERLGVAQWAIFQVTDDLYTESHFYRQGCTLSDLQLLK